MQRINFQQGVTLVFLPTISVLFTHATVQSTSNQTYIANH